MWIWCGLCFNEQRMRLMAVLVALIRLWFMSSWWIDWKRCWSKPCRAHADKQKHMNLTKTNLPHLIASPVCREITFIWAFLLVTPSHIFNFSFLYFFMISSLFYLHHFRTTVWCQCYYLQVWACAVTKNVIFKLGCLACWDFSAPHSRINEIENGIKRIDRANHCMAMDSMN